MRRGGPARADVPHPGRSPEETPRAEGGQVVVYRPSLGSPRGRPYGGHPGRRAQTRWLRLRVLR